MLVQGWATVRDDNIKTTCVKRLVFSAEATTGLTCSLLDDNITVHLKIIGP